jgi:predicted DNA binding protein
MALTPRTADEIPVVGVYSPPAATGNVATERFVDEVVGDYPPRPDDEALTDEQKDILKAAGLR